MHVSGRYGRWRSVLGSLTALSFVGWVGLYSDAPPNGHTGGFAEPTCHRCHFDRELNDPRGAIEIRGIPASFLHGKTYDVHIVLEHPELRLGGFQVSARFGEKTRLGRQAGQWSATDMHTVRVSTDSTDVEFVTHAKPSGSPGRAVWQLSWRAPIEGERVLFHVAGNASNDDNSEFGDFIMLGLRETTANPSVRQ